MRVSVTAYLLQGPPITENKSQRIERIERIDRDRDHFKKRNVLSACIAHWRGERYRILQMKHAISHLFQQSLIKATYCVRESPLWHTVTEYYTINIMR
jgi:hypothetical protein